MTKLQTKLREEKFALMIEKADRYGREAAEACRPAAMVVSDPRSGKTYVVSDGVCGFAWVNVRPGTSPFARWLVKTGRARKDSYLGGVSIWCHDYRQSMTLKEAYCRAFASYLRIDEGIDARYGSRMD